MNLIYRECQFHSNKIGKNRRVEISKTPHNLTTLLNFQHLNKYKPGTTGVGAARKAENIEEGVIKLSGGGGISFQK